MSPVTTGASSSTTGRPTLERLVEAFDPRESDIVFLSGSRLEGFGNEHSDYDLYVVQPSGFSGLPFITVVLDGQYAVCETFSAAHVTRVAETLNGMDTANAASVWRLSWFDLEFYYRVLIGKALTNAGAFLEMKRHFRKEVIDACVQAWCGLRAVCHLEEARRKLAVGKRIGAYMSAQQASSAAVDSFLAEHGESYPGFKWRFEKLQRRFGESDSAFRSAWSLKSLGTRTVDEYVAEVGRFCDDLGMRRFDGWSLGDVVHRRVETATVLTLQGRPYVVENRNRLYELTDAGRTLWDWIDGSTPRRELMARATGAGLMAEEEVDGFLFDLASSALIR